MKYIVKQKRVNFCRGTNRRSAKTRSSLLPSNSISRKVSFFFFFFAVAVLPLAEDYSPVFVDAARSLFRHRNRCVFFLLPPRNLSGFRSSQISQALPDERNAWGQCEEKNKKKLEEMEGRYDRSNFKTRRGY